MPKWVNNFQPQLKQTLYRHVGECNWQDLIQSTLTSGYVTSKKPLQASYLERSD